MQSLLVVAESKLITQVALYTLIPFVMAFAFIFFVFYRQNRENQVKKDLVELELKALRAQMNPHFIFNCLNSIYYCIKEGKQEKAGDYLLKFSYLTRRVLENSGKRWISLAEEIQMLQAYMDLEQLRTEHKFRYNIEVNAAIDSTLTSVPMLLIQPLIENSIWHGFSVTTNQANIDISIFTDGKKLVFELDDNGSKAISHPDALGSSKQLSMGTSLVKEQLNAIEILEKKKCELVIQEKTDPRGNYSGRKVLVSIPLLSLH